MFKRFPLFATLMVLGLGFLACDEAETPEETKQVAAASYSGTLSVDQLDSTFYDTDSVVVSIEPVAISSAAGDFTFLRIMMHQVRFSPRMPMSLDMTINDVTYVAGEDGFALSGDSIVPFAMGGPFPTYLITDLQGVVKDNELTVSMTCGRFPMTYSGSLVVEP